jgi:hypothetical protein
VVEKPRRFTIPEFAPQSLEVGKTSLSKDRHLAIDDGLANLELRSRFRNGRKLLRPVVAAPGVDCHSPVVQVNLRPITIYLDLVNSVVAGRSLFLESRIARLYKSWHRRFGGGRHVLCLLLGRFNAVTLMAIR